jgi:sugar phosphate isomerase/epimerase
MKVGVDSYCYHRYFGEVYDTQTDPGVRWATDDFVRRAIELEVDGVSLELCFFPSFDDDYLADLKRMLDEAGIERVAAWGHPDGLEAGGNKAELRDMIRHIDTAVALGADVMRIVASSLMFRDEPHGPQLANLTRMLKEATKVAASKGVILAVENHIDYTAAEILQLLDDVGSDHLGVNFDTGNCLRMFEDPVEAARLLADRIHATHIKDLMPTRGGSPSEWDWWESVPAGHGLVDVLGVMQALKDAGYEGTCAVEVDCLSQQWEEDEAVEISVAYLREQAAKLT